MPKKKRGPPMVMKDDDVEYRRRLLERWDYACIVCGYGFANLACVTKEHIVPRSSDLKTKIISENIGPSHHQCNKLRGTLSIIEASRLIEHKKVCMGSQRFFVWLASHVPHRIVPHAATLPPRPLRCLELPENLPGIP